MKTNRTMTATIILLGTSVLIYSSTISFGQVQNLSGKELPSTASTESATSEYLKLVKEAEAKSQEKKWVEAALLWERATVANPVFGNNWTQLGRALYESKQYRKAITAYEEFIELGIGYPWDGPYSIACCYALLGEKEKALEWLEKALKLGFRDLKQVQTDTDFESLRNNPKYRELAALVDVSKFSRSEGWRYDLSLLAREVKRIHYNPYRKFKPAEFDVSFKTLDENIPKLNDPQIVVGMMKLMRMLGDGHSQLWGALRRGGKNLPVQFYLFREGLFITAAAPEQKDLIGAQVLKIGDNTVEKVIESLDAINSQDNKMWIKYMATRFIQDPFILNGLGLIPDSDKVVLTLRDLEGKARTVTLAGTSADPQATDLWVTFPDATKARPLYLQNPKPNYWFEYLPERKMVFFQYNLVWNDDKEPFAAFCRRLFNFINEQDVETLVIDMRSNTGGNLFLNRPLIQGLVGNQKINQRGKLFVIIGRKVFSAAMNGVAQINKYAAPIFVGEPTGSSPNFVGESIPFELPYSKITGNVSDLYWQGTVAMDYRTWIAPELYAPPSFELFMANRDPAMEAILSYLQDK